MSAAEVEENYGDRIRRAPAVVNAGRHKSTRHGALAGINGLPASRRGAPTATKGFGAPADSVDGDGGTNLSVANGGGREAEVDGRPVGQGGTGLYQPRTSGRMVGGSLGKRFNDEQVSSQCSPFSFAVFLSPASWHDIFMAFWLHVRCNVVVFFGVFFSTVNWHAGAWRFGWNVWLSRSCSFKSRERGRCLTTV